MRRAALTLAVLMLTVPMAASAQSGSGGGTGPSTERITFYGHVFGHGMGGEGNLGPQPANTEPPIGESIYGFGSYHWCTPAGTASLGGLEPDETCSSDEENVLALFSTAGPVDVDTPTEFEQGGAYAQLHNERGQTKDVHLGSGSVQAAIFLTVDRHGWPTGGQPYGTSCIYAHPPNVPCLYPYWGWDMGAQPSFTVEATLYQADLGSRTNSSAAPPVAEAIESGDAKVVAKGSTTKQLAMNGLPGTPKALQYDVDLGAPQMDTIARSNDFFLTYRFYSETSDQRWGLASWRLWSGEFFPPSFSMPVENPITVERVIPTFVHNKLAILGVVNTPWGSYDVDRDSVDLEVTGPSGSSVQPDRLSTTGLSRSVAHGGHFKPVNKTWIWDYQRDADLSPGNYTVTVSASNVQGSASASCSASFVLERGSSGSLVPEATNPGTCGQQTISQQEAQQLKQGANETAEG